MADLNKTPDSTSASMQGDFLAQFQQSIAKLTEDLKKAQQYTRELEASKKDSEAKLANALKSELELVNARQRIEDLEKGRNQAEVRLASAMKSEQELVKARQQIEELVKGRNQVEIRLANAMKSEEELLKSKQRIQELEKLKNESDDKLVVAVRNRSDLENKITELQAWQDEAIERAQGMFRKHEELIHVLEETEASEQQAIDKLSAYEQDISLMRQENAKMQSTLASSEKAAVQQKGELESERQRMASVVAEKDKGLSESKSALQQMKDAMSRSQRMAEQAMQELEAKKQELQVIQLNKQQQEKTLQAMRNEQAMLQQTLSTANDQAKKQLSEEKLRMAKELEEREKGINRAKSDLEMMREAMSRSQKMAEQAMSELNEARSKLSSQANELELSKKRLEDDRTLSRKQLDERQAEYHKLQGTVTAVQIKLDEAVERLAKGDREQASLKRKVQQLETDLVEAKGLIAAKQAEVEVARKEVLPLQEALTKAQHELQQSKVELAANNQELEFIISRIGFLSDRLNPGSGTAVTSALRQLPGSVTAAAPVMPVSPAPVPWTAPAPAPVARTAGFPMKVQPPVVSSVQFPGQGPQGVFSMSGINLEQLALVDFPGDVPITIPELLCACLDPNWREAWIQGARPDVFRLIPKDLPVSAGGYFYEIVEEFCDWLISDSAYSLGVGEWSEQELWKHLHDHHVEQRLNDFVARGQFNETNFLSRRLRSFCGRLIALRNRTPGFTGWSDLFPRELIDVPRAVFPMGDCRLVVTGTIYGSRKHPDYGLELVDYKLVPTAPEGNHLLTLALNALILGAMRPNLTFALGLESYAPEVDFIPVSHDTVNTLLRERIVPVFYELAGRPAPADLRSQKLEFVRPPDQAGMLH